MTASLPKPSCATAIVVEGLPPGIDVVANRAAPSCAFLRRGWFAAAVDAYGGRPRTIVVRDQSGPALALPLVGVGLAALKVVAVPGCYWPFRSFPLAEEAGEAVLDAALAALAREVRVLRVGPVPDGDPGMTALLGAARARGWAAIDRVVAESWLFPIGDARDRGDWPRASTLKKNRFHEKHLGSHGALDWRFLGAGDWPGAFDHLAEVERKSWVATRTDGRDAKFLGTPHAAFWRAAARDPALAGMMRAALLSVNGAPAAFSFDLVAGGTCYAIANSYDPAYAKHSPGKLLYTRNLLDLADKGVRTIDWGMGDSGYKQVIGAEPGPVMRDWLLVRPGLAARAARRLAGRWARSGRG